VEYLEKQSTSPANLTFRLELFPEKTGGTDFKFSEINRRNHKEIWIFGNPPKIFGLQFCRTLLFIVQLYNDFTIPYPIYYPIYTFIYF